MKKAILFLAIFSSLSAFADGTIGFDEAQQLACAELERQSYEVDGGCEVEISLEKETKSYFEFLALDISGDCGAHVFVTKKDGKVKTKISCY